MDKSILDEKLIQKNIEKLKYYANEEKDSLQKIESIFTSINNCYHSTNDLVFSSNDLNFKIIHEKREKYVFILNKVVNRYKGLNEKTISFFNNRI